MVHLGMVSVNQGLAVRIVRELKPAHTGLLEVVIGMDDKTARRQESHENRSMAGDAKNRIA